MDAVKTEVKDPGDGAHHQRLGQTGHPVMRQLPPAKSVKRISSTAAFCPMMTRPSSCSIFSRLAAICSTACRSSSCMVSVVFPV
ncbi:MAG: hypothetical protein Ct9H300mP32_6160 [Verrucomicrobiota bacterium]|nr:MAG: hypothetical protein Ct9H300mP32_6160 [Verrucomicrobiota bacterium]